MLVSFGGAGDGAMLMGKHHQSAASLPHKENTLMTGFLR